MPWLGMNFLRPHGEPFGAESSVESGFDVFIAFSKLDTVRKMKLFDLLCGHRAVAYKATMKSFGLNLPKKMLETFYDDAFAYGTS